LHLAFIGVAVFLGWLMLQGLLFGERFVPVLRDNHIFEGFPLFPLCMIGGLIVNYTCDKVNSLDLIDHGLSRRLAGLALDFWWWRPSPPSVSASSRTNRSLPHPGGRGHGMERAVRAVSGAALVCRRLVRARHCRDGQSMGVTATVCCCCGPWTRERDQRRQAFAYKQLLHEPFMGGGLWTSSAIPLIALAGACRCS
jgi:ESS family glutamate:Na+ symporter